MPDFTFDKLDAIPEELRGDVKQVDGKFVVNLVSNKKLVEFRDNNIALAQERDQLKSRVVAYTSLGEDPAKLSDEVKELRTVAQQVKDGKLKGTADIEAEVANRSKAVRESLEAQVREKAAAAQNAEAAAGTWRSKFDNLTLNQHVTNAVIGTDSIANPSALPDIISRAARVFQVQPDGSIVPKDGDTIIYGADGVKPMTPKEWLVKLVAEAPYLGKSSSGGGAGGGGAGSYETKYGMSEEAFNKMSPEQRVQMARKAQKGK